MIKILFLAANPSDTAQLRLDEEMRTIDAKIQPTEFRDLFEIRQHWAVRISDLQGLVLRHKPNIVHFSGHGSVGSEIVLKGDDGRSRPVSVEALSRLFSLLSSNVRCVVLNACYTQPQAQAIAEHIDCVTGMSKAIGDSAAIVFAGSFYQALGYGRSIKTAFELARNEIDLRNLREEDTPKLLALRANPADIVLARRPSPRGPGGKPRPGNVMNINRAEGVFVQGDVTGNMIGIDRSSGRTGKKVAEGD